MKLAPRTTFFRAAALSLTALSGCSLLPTPSATYYTKPTPIAVDNSVIIPKPRADVWTAAVPALAKQLYVINNMDQGSGLINLSFTGNPSTYLDCGVAEVKNGGMFVAQSNVLYGASPDVTYDVYVGGLSPTQIRVHRRLALEGRVSLVFEAVEAGATRVTANVRYLVTRTVAGVSSGEPASTRTDAIAFNTGAGETFPDVGPGGAATCVPTGRAESDLLKLLR